MAFEPKIRKASKKRAKLRMAIGGATGSGKTYSAIKIAKHLIGEPYRLPEGQTSRIVVIDTERNSAELYADEFDFQHCELPPEHWSPKDFKSAVQFCERSADVIIPDSITHEWKYCLNQVDILKPKFGGNTWSTWSAIRPPHDDFIDALMASKAHIIATMRSKMATMQDKDSSGKTVIKQVGLESIQADDLDYAFTVVLDMEKENHAAHVRKTRCSALDGRVFPLPGADIAAILNEWLNSGEAPEVPAPRVSAEPMPPAAISQAASKVAEAAQNGALDADMLADKVRKAFEAAKTQADVDAAGAMGAALDSGRKRALMPIREAAIKRVQARPAEQGAA